MGEILKLFEDLQDILGNLLLAEGGFSTKWGRKGASGLAHESVYPSATQSLVMGLFHISLLDTILL